MKYSIILIFLFLSINVLQAQKSEINVIPKPLSVEYSVGQFKMDKNVRLFTGFQPEIFKASKAFIDYFRFEVGFHIDIDRAKEDKIKYISLALTDTAEWCGEEGYHLEIRENGINIIAKEEAGLFYALQTLKQIFLYSPNETGGFEEKIFFAPACIIHDKPRFQWRGMNLDCCRHFMEKEFVLRYIDLLAFHKMNVLHWHLTEDQGWRIEIKKYPKLTEIGAWRIEEDGTRYGGYYTQEDIREIVAYAAERYITVVPEIEMPGHSMAALAAYPQLSCTGGPFEVENRWGVFKDIYCAGNDSVFVFLQDVLTEVMELFPSEYIHIGGDEAPKYQWENCPKCQKRIKEEGLADEHELQSWFITEIERFLNDHDRKLIGWDEILEGGLAPSATVQSWRGFDGAHEAAMQNHTTIVSPTSHCYFDYDIATTNLEKVYSFEPIPDGLPTDKYKYILGGECNMWTEYAPQELIDSKVFPRLCAISEVLWSPNEKRSFEEFHKRMENHYTLLDKLGVLYGFENQPIIVEAYTNTVNSNFKVSLIPGQEGLQIYYTLNGEEPDENSEKWMESFYSDTSFTLKAIAIGPNIKSEVYTREFKSHKAWSKVYQYNAKYSDHYPASGEGALVDGVRGTNHYRDGIWQGYSGTDLSVTIFFGDTIEISRIKAGFLQSSLSWIFYPEKMEVYTSYDNENWEKRGEYVNTWPQKDEKMTHMDFSVDFDPVKTNMIKVSITNMKTCPDWHPGAGSKTWMFIDEIIVE